MVRQSTPKSVLAERFFPARPRVAVPPKGLGQQLTLTPMYDRLHAHVGREGYWVGGDAGPSRPDAVLVHFLDVRAAHAFVDRFACGLPVRASARAEDRPR